MTYSTLATGTTLKAGSRVTLGLDASYTKAKEEPDPLGLGAPPDILAKLTGFSYDFTLWHTYSRLESTSWDATFRAEARLAARLAGLFSYTYMDFNDNARYLDNLSGNLDIVRLALRWTL
ncbi:MAG: hypothetical protein HRF46_13060 [Acidobacteriota bacterium]|jgi:hypothetical protein